jgi:hypothetical protein
MRIDIDHLTEAELVDLNHRVVERLRFLHQMRSHKRMLDFRIGDRVAFQSQEGRTVTGVLSRYNKKTVTVIADTGERWNVSPNLLTQVAERAPDGAPSALTPVRK